MEDWTPAASNRSVTNISFLLLFVHHTIFIFFLQDGVILVYLTH